MRPLRFAANWKMHIGPDEARAYLKTFRARYGRREDRDVWFFPPAVSLEAAAQAVRERPDLSVGAQLYAWTINVGKGKATGPSGGFILPSGANRSPDAAWISPEQWALVTPEQRKKFIEE